jgi:Arc/MetJ family transcription regulator
MATNLHIDDKLMAQALKAGGRKNKRETVNEALTEYVQRRAQAKIIEAFGTLEDSDFWDPAPARKPLKAPTRAGKKK